VEPSVGTKEDNAMAYYLFQGTLTTAVWDEALKIPGDRISILSKSVETLGGSLVGGWYSFGDYDILLVLELPDNVSAGAFAIAAAASTTFTAVKTTALLSPDDAVAAMKLAQG
jgi:uncharacterized protein with GYD domain